MGKYNSMHITTNNLTDRIDLVIGYLNGLEIDDEQIIEAIIESIQIDGRDFYGVQYTIKGSDIVCFFGYDTTLRLTGVYIRKGDDYILPITWTGNDYQGAYGMYVHSYIDKECIIIALADEHNGRATLNVTLTNVDNNKRLIGYSYFTNNTGTVNGFADISTYVFKNMDDLVQTYAFANMFNYYALDGALDFLAQSYFVTNTNYKTFTSTFMKACSTMQLLSTASLTSTLGNHLAIGAHCIVPIDPENEEEEVDE